MGGCRTRGGGEKVVLGARNPSGAPPDARQVARLAPYLRNVIASRHLQAFVAAALFATCALAAFAGDASGATPGCGTTTAQSQNGNQLFVSGTGADCLRRAFGTCRAATLTVRGHGVDAQLVLTFAVGRRAGACRVGLTGSNTVFFGSKTRKTTWSSTCTTVAKRAEGVVLGGCTGGDYLLSPPGAPQVPNNRF
jgi:hypothetical protein